MALITPGMVRAIGERKQCANSDLALREFECEKGSYLFFNYNKKIPTQYCLGKMRFLGNQAVCPMRFVSGLHSACAQPTGLVFRGKTSAGLPRRVLYLVSIFCVNQTDGALNFVRGQTSAGDTYVY